MYEQMAHFYDLTHERLTADIDFVLALAAEAEGPVLELGCGTGRLLRPLARAGHIVTGVDISAAMLARARQHLLTEAPEVQAHVTLVEGDMVQLSAAVIAAEFSLAIIPYNTILHVAEGQLGQVLRGIWRKLGSNGRLFIDTMNPFTVDQFDDEDGFVVEDVLLDPRTKQQIVQSSQIELDAQNQILNISWLYETLVADRQLPARYTIEMCAHYRFPHQLEMALQAAGFRLQKLLGDYAGSPFHSASERLLLMAIKETAI